MNKLFYIGLLFYLIEPSISVGQSLQEFHAINLVGSWQTDSVSQLSKNANLLSLRDSPLNIVLSADMQRAINSREYKFHNDGVFTANWVMGSKPFMARGTWNILDKNRIVIVIDGKKTEYSINENGKERVVLTPLRERRGEIHELYFIKQKEK